MRTILCSIMLLCFAITTSYATEQYTHYLPDPIYTPLYESATHPLADMMNMASNGDIRSQYILADLYLKGKGGFAPNIKKAKYWFEQSAKQKYLHSFIRLAAIAKHEKNAVTAYQWYFSGLKYSKKEDEQIYDFIKKQIVTLIKDEELSRKDIRHGKKQAKVWIKSLPPKKIFTTPRPQYN